MRHLIRPRRKLEHRNFKPLLDMINKIEVKEIDYFKTNKICVVGTRHPYSHYQNLGRFPDLDFMYQDLVGWSIDPTQHLNMSICAGSGLGKGKITKSIIAQYHKQGYRILVFSPKEDEFSISKKTAGKGEYLHPLMEKLKLPIVSYMPSYVKFRREERGFPTKGYKFYSHTIKNFTSIDMWNSLGLSMQMSGYCVKKINSGVGSLTELQEQIEHDSKQKLLFPGHVMSAKFVIDNLIGTKYIDEKLPPLDLNNDWGWNKEDKGKPIRNNNICVFNYFALRDHSFMNSDIFRVLNYVREIVQSARKNGFNDPVLCVLDDLNYYGAKNSDNELCIQAIVDLQINLRKLGIHNILAFQYPESVHPDIMRGSTSMLVSYVQDPRSFSGVLNSDTIYTLSASEDEGGLTINKPHIVEWIFRTDSREWFTFFPFGVITGHDFS